MIKLTSFLLLTTLGVLTAVGQNVSSTLKATARDPAGAAVPSAQCELTSATTNAVLRTGSVNDGTCTFNSVLPGTYHLKVNAPGFKAYEVREIVLNASEVRAIPNIVLQIGDVQESVSVTAEVATIQTESSERSGLVTGNQLQNIALRGRDFFALLNTIPGIIDAGTVRRETSSPESIQGTYINGMRDNQKNFTTDGISSMDTGSNQTVHFQPNMDAIGEVRVLTSNYQAEYGRNAGGVVSVITKSGSQDFHGSAYNYYRHESLNANSFFNNRSNTAKAPYRYRITGYSLGGPIYIPGKFNKNKDKLFFFWSQEFTGIKRDYGTRFASVPTELERAGDFSQSVDVGGRPIIVTDPATRQPFPNNIIPSTRINTLGQSMLKYFPSPNFVDPDPTLRNSRNYRAQYSGDYPRRQDMIRVDYNISDTLRAHYRYVQDDDKQTAPWGLWVNGSINFLATPLTFGQPGHGHVAHVTKTFSPTLVNETIFGKSYNKVHFDAVDPSAIDRGKMGNPPQWFNDPSGVASANYIPNVTFGSPVPNPVVASLFHPPYVNYNDIWSLVNNTSKVMGSHSIRAGFYFERTLKFAPNWANYRGAWSFANDVNNPGNTGHPFANALLGNYTSYTEGTKRLMLNLWFTNFEWYAQDSWRVSSRLTLDYGIRFYHMPNVYDEDNQIAVFDPSAYNASKAVSLYYPGRQNGNSVAVDPRTGATVNPVYIGRLVPDSGDVANGMRVAGQNGFPRGLMEGAGIQVAPRFGFAYDVFGNGRTAVRGGAGIFYDRPQGQPWVDASGQPPIAYTPASFYGNLSTFGQGGTVLAPSGLTNVIGKGVLPTTYMYSFGIQQSLLGMTLDASYVGSQSRHLLVTRNINPIPLGARFDPANQNPATPGTALADNFLRPYVGYGDILNREFSSTSNYNSLQVSLNRRFAHGIQFGLAYTFSKAMGVASGDSDAISPYFSPTDRNYGPLAFDRTHALVVNYIYDVPKIAERIGFKPLRWVTDSWQLSGITSLVTGGPYNPALSTTDAYDFTGSSEGARVDVVGDPTLPASERSFGRNIRTEAFARPGARSFGNAGWNILRGPGTNNWDISATKRFPLGSETRFLQFRTELFNAFNHTQFSAINATATFNAQGAQVNQNFGAYSAARDPRMIQLSLRLAF